MPPRLPEVTRTYQNHTLDSMRWQRYQPRAGDIVIATSYKSGTNWMQEIVRQLIFQGQDVPEREDVSLKHISFWLEQRSSPLDDLLKKLEAQQHRRFLMCHLPLDGLPFFPQMQYIVVGRDARDVGMSLWNHYSEMADPTFAKHSSAQPEFEPLPHPPEDVHAFWQRWITQGYFPWESEGYPFWGNLHHTQSWWPYRHLPNILFVHYNDLKTDLAGEIRRVADFLAIPLVDALLPAIMQAANIDVMRAREERLKSPLLAALKNGGNSFFFKGTNGRWRGVLSADEVQLYEEKAAKVLTPACRAWLEQGRQAGL